MFCSALLAGTYFLSVLVPSPLPEKEPEVSVPSTAPPRFAVVENIDLAERRITLAVCEPVAEQQTIQVEVIKNGEKVAENQVVTRYRTTLNSFSLSLGSLSVMDAAGTKFKADESWNKVTRGKLVVLAADAKGVDRVFLKMFADGTIVLIRTAESIADANRDQPRRP